MGDIIYVVKEYRERNEPRQLEDRLDEETLGESGESLAVEEMLEWARVNNKPYVRVMRMDRGNGEDWVELYRRMP